MNLRLRLQRILDQKKIAPSRFGRTYFSDPGFVSRFLKGADIRQSTSEKLERAIRELESADNQ